MRSLVQGYDELRLRIDGREAGLYRVHASTGSAEASLEFELPFNELEVENFILKVSRPRGRRRIDSSATGDARRFGGSLFKAVFHGQIYDLYHDAVAHARTQGRGVRITLCLSDSPELIDVPWEYLFDDPDFLAVSAFTPVVRYLDLPRAHRPLLVERPLRVLGLVSSPAEYERLDVERERDNLQRALSGMNETGAVELHWLEPPTLGALLKALQTQPFHALHYVGHGAYDRDTERGILMFEDGSGWAHPVSGDKLGMILHDFSSLRLAVLNACEGARTSRNDPFAGVAGALVRRDIPAVVAMQFEISDEAAIVFAGGFYRPLAAGAPVDESLAAARLAMLAERSEDIEWGTPVLFMRVADGKIFDLVDQPEPRTLETSVHSAGPLVAEPHPAVAGRTAVELQPATAAKALQTAFLVWRDAGGDQVIFGLGDVERATIGRRTGNTVVIVDDEISRVHAELELSGGGWTATDAGLSRNGTYVNGVRITRRHRLRDGDLLRIGRTTIEYRCPADGSTIATKQPEGFLTGTRTHGDDDRVLATVLFTDIVGSTTLASQLGDRKWRALLDAHDEMVREQLERFDGHEVKSTGDGFLATFDRPARAIRCAVAIRDGSHGLGIELRAGLHTGELGRRGDDVRGIAVHICSRVAACARGDEVLVSSTVKDLVAGSGLEFADRGEQALKGVEGTWHLFAVVG